MPQFPHLCHGDNGSTFRLRPLRGFITQLSAQCWAWRTGGMRGWLHPHLAQGQQWHPGQQHCLGAQSRPEAGGPRPVLSPFSGRQFSLLRNGGVTPGPKSYYQGEAQLTVLQDSCWDSLTSSTVPPTKSGPPAHLPRRQSLKKGTGGECKRRSARDHPMPGTPVCLSERQFPRLSHGLQCESSERSGAPRGPSRVASPLPTVAATWGLDGDGSAWRLTMGCGPDRRGSVGWVSSHKTKGRRFNSWSGHTPGLQARPLAGGVRETTYPYISHTSMFLSLSFSLPSPLSKIQ